MPLYTTEGGWLHLETAALVEDAVRAQGQGFGGCKIKVGPPPQQDVARLRAVRAAEFSLSLAAAAITAAVGVVGKGLLFGWHFDFVALTAVLTTIAGAIVAHMEASRYDNLVMSYRATARPKE